jgi:hypothetical protein
MNITGWCTQKKSSGFHRCLASSVLPQGTAGLVPVVPGRMCSWTNCARNARAPLGLLFARGCACHKPFHYFRISGKRRCHILSELCAYLMTSISSSSLWSLACRPPLSGINTPAACNGTPGLTRTARWNTFSPERAERSLRIATRKKILAYLSIIMHSSWSWRLNKFVASTQKQNSTFSCFCLSVCLVDSGIWNLDESGFHCATFYKFYVFTLISRACRCLISFHVTFRQPLLSS